jgi:EamA-like transporter family protein
LASLAPFFRDFRLLWLLLKAQISALNSLPRVDRGRGKYCPSDFDCQQGLQYTTVIQGTLIAAALPIFVLVAARVFLDQPITGRQLVGIVISVIGGCHYRRAWRPPRSTQFCAERRRCLDTSCRVYVGRSNNSDSICAEGNGSRCLSGDGLRRWARGLGALLYLRNRRRAAAAAQLECGAARWLCRPSRERRRLHVLELGSDAGPKTAGYFGNLFPVFGAALGILLLGEQFRWFHAVGGIVTVSGIYLATVAAPADQVRVGHQPQDR